MVIIVVMVKELCDLIGVGMMDVKKVLIELNGDMEVVVDWLCIKGLVKVVKKLGCIVVEGLVVVVIDGGKGVVVEVNLEIDFVVKNVEFQEMVVLFVGVVINVVDVDVLSKVEIDGKVVEIILIDKIVIIGENMILCCVVYIEGVLVVFYVYNVVIVGMGKIGVLVVLLVENEVFGKQVVMYIVVVNLVVLGEVDLDVLIVEKECQVQIDIVCELGKLDVVIEKMIVGCMKKFIVELILLGQVFVVNLDLIVEVVVKEVGVEIIGFICMEVGEGIEKEEIDFVVEVVVVVLGS